MPLSAGTRLGPYEIIALIGAGGMGEVYRARDTRLGRVVAIKICAEQFSERFELEARAVAALNHPNICILHDVGPNYLVMEYIEGKPLKGPLPLDTVLKYAAQICDGLEAAHRKGITHRDLKPANILVTKAGIKLLDFGLAKIGQASQPPSDATLTMAVTGKNEIVGTFYYMSPEQIQAKPSDARTDIFSFGLILYEMLAGKRAFEAENPASLIAAILERPAPSITRVAPAALDRILQRCLAKDPDQRWDSAGDLRFALDGVGNEKTASRSPAKARGLVLFAVLALLLIVLASTAWLAIRSFSATNHEDWLLSMEGPAIGLELSVAPDSSAVLYSAGNTLQMRHLNTLAPVTLPADARFSPSWSPDGQSIAFFTLEGATTSLKRIGLRSGAPEVIASGLIASTRGATWGSTGIILFAMNDPSSTGGGLYIVPAAGGTVQRLRIPDREGGDDLFFAPEFLPNGEDFLFIWEDRKSGFKRGLYMATIKDSKLVRQPVLLRPMDLPVHFSAVNNSVLYLEGNRLYAQKLNIRTMRLEGEPVSIIDGVSSFPGNYHSLFAVSNDGMLVWRRGDSLRSQLTWFDRTGKQLATTGPLSNYIQARISPDETKVVAWSRTGGPMLMDANERGAVRMPSMYTPLWAHNGAILAFQDHIGDSSVLRYAPSSKADVKEVAHVKGSPRGSGSSSRLLDISPDDNQLLYGRGSGLYTVSARNADERLILNVDGSDSIVGRFSPDGRWIVYQSDTPGNSGIFVQPSDGTGLRKQLDDQGIYPVWRGDSKEILFIKRRGAKASVCSVPVHAGTPALSFGTETCLFEVTTADWVHGYTPFDVTKDGSRFLFPIFR